MMFRKSPYLRFVRGTATDDVLAYHSLFGNPRIISAEAVDLLESFNEPLDDTAIDDLVDGDCSHVMNDFRSIHFLVADGADEREIIRDRQTEHVARVARKETVDRMGLAISDACNFGCTHCIHFQNDANDGQKLPVYSKPVKQLNMSWTTAKSCIDHYVCLIRQNGSSEGKIHFGNAEPLLNFPVISQVLEYCSTIPGITFKFSINTNLSLLTEQIAQVFKRYNVRIATSLDGAEDANDAIRVTAGGEGTFSRIIAKFDLLSSIGYPLDGFSITVTRKNYHLIGTNIIDIATARSMTSIAFDYDLVSLVDIPVSERVEKLMQLKRYANERGIDFFGTWDSPFRNLTSVSLLDGTHAFCAAVQGKALQFNVDGTIKVCSHTTTNVGSVHSPDEFFSESGKFVELVKARFPGTDEYCGGCEIEGQCGGQCHVTREVMERSQGNTRQRLFEQMCDFYRSITATLARDYLETGEAAAAQSSTPNCQN